MPRSTTRFRWDIFCQVIDNFGDIGVCWRLASDLAQRGHQVRLWVDDASALAWMAPSGCPGVQVLPWTQPLAPGQLHGLPPADVWIEAFGCRTPPEFVDGFAEAVRARGVLPVWINLEYLSAEAYVERSHGLPSPAPNAPVAGGVKWFFYPGFTPRTGGLLREPDLLQRQAAFDPAAWLAAQSPGWQPEPGFAASAGDQLVSLFCYEPAALAGLLAQLIQGPARTHLLVTSGRASAAVRACLASVPSSASAGALAGALAISYLPAMSQRDYDHLLWSCDLNFVRGEDSVVRAVWAGRPFIWQIYPQDDGVHHGKLDAFLSQLQAPASLRLAHHAWNSVQAGETALPALTSHLLAWGEAATGWRQALLGQEDLVSQLLQFVLKKR